MASAQCPPQRISAHKITEPEAIDLAQKYADANLKGYKVAQPTSGTGKLSKGPAYGGGYPTTCFNKDGDAFHSVEYSFEAKNVKGTSRLLSVDQFGAVREYRETASR
jgi:predicted RNA methylase